MIKYFLNRFLGITISRFDKRKLVFKGYYKSFADFTMIPEDVYVDNLLLIDDFINESITGDVVECGVWRGGMTAGIATMIGKGRKYYLFDSFEGLPEAKNIDGDSAIAWQNDVTSPNYYDNCAAEEKYSRELLSSLNVEYEIYKGWFDQTLPTFTPSNEIAILRLDADWYESTMICFKELYSKVAFNGIIIIDDYYVWDGCARAVHDFLSSINSASRIQSFNDKICFIIKKDKSE